MNKTTFTVQPDGKTLVAERVFDAPQHKVWEAYTTPELLARWWGPRGWDTEIKHMDFSEGGYLLYGMKCNDPAQGDFYGKYSWGKSTYRTIKPEEAFSYTDIFCDENGTPQPGMPEMGITVELRDEGDRTKLVSTSEFASADALKQVIDTGMEQGFTETWDRLAESLDSE